MRSIWSGQLGVGLISLKVKLYKASETNGTGLHLVHDCGNGHPGGISYLYKCKACQKVLESRNELKKGYELTKDTFVILEDSDLQRLPLKSTKQIDIIGFCQEAIDPRTIDTAYYLIPDKGGEKPYSLLYGVMGKVQVKAIAKLTMREREHLCVIYPFYGGVMLCQTLIYADELRGCQEITPKLPNLSEKEMQLGEMMVNKLTAIFEHTSFTNEYRQALESLIQAKVEGKEIPQLPEGKPTDNGDLAEQLLAMIGSK